MNVQENKNNLSVISQWLGTGSINIFGRPFSGKDTQGNRLVKLFNAKLIGGGDIIRRSDVQHVKDIIDKGNLAPQADYLNMVLPYLSRDEFKASPLILSSLGRWLGEEQPVLEATAQANHPIKAVITLTIPEDTVHERWKAAQSGSERGNRRDDDEQHISTRLKEYREKTIPVLNFYRSRNLLVEVDGTQDPDKVTADILAHLLTLAKKDSNA